MGQLKGLEPWKVIGAAGQPAFQGAWVNFGGAYYTAAFRKLASGLVVLRGTIKSGAGAGAVIFTLPAGYRPAATILLGAIEKPAGAATTDSELDIAANGDVTWFGSNAPTLVGLDGLTFMAEA